MESRNRLLIRNMVHKCRESLFHNYGKESIDSNFNFEKLSMDVLDKIDPWVEMDCIAFILFEELVAEIDKFSYKGSFEVYLIEIEKAAKASTYQSYNINTTIHDLLESLDWVSIETNFKRRDG